jgi:hypothetical protein
MLPADELRRAATSKSAAFKKKRERESEMAVNHAKGPSVTATMGSHQKGLNRADWGEKKDERSKQVQTFARLFRSLASVSHQVWKTVSSSLCDLCLLPICRRYVVLINFDVIADDQQSIRMITLLAASELFWPVRERERERESGFVWLGLQVKSGVKRDLIASHLGWKAAAKQAPDHNLNGIAFVGKKASSLSSHSSVEKTDEQEAARIVED